MKGKNNILTREDLIGLIQSTELSQNVDIIRARKDEIIDTLKRAFEEHREEFRGFTDNPEEVIRLLINLLYGIIEDGDERSLRNQALNYLKNDITPHHLSRIISRLLEYAAPMLKERVPEADSIIQTLRLYAVILIALLSDEMARSMLKSIEHATGMSLELLNNFMRAVIDDEISKNQ